MSATFDPNDPRLTAFALGELDDLDPGAIEALLASSDDARRLVESIRATAQLLTEQLHAESAPRLAPSQLEAIEGFLPKPAPRTPFRWRALASAAAVLIAGGGAVALWRYQTPREETAAVLGNTPASQMIQAAAEAATPTASAPATPTGVDPGMGFAELAQRQRRLAEMPKTAPAGRPPVTVFEGADLTAKAPATPADPASGPVPGLMAGRMGGRDDYAMRGMPRGGQASQSGGQTSQMMGGMGGGMGGMGSMSVANAPSRSRSLAYAGAKPQPRGGAGYPGKGKDVALQDHLRGRRPMPADDRSGATEFAFRAPAAPAATAYAPAGTPSEPGQTPAPPGLVVAEGMPAPAAAAPAGPPAKPGQQPAATGLVAAGGMPAPADRFGRSVALGLEAAPNALAKPAREAAAVARAEAALDSSRKALRRSETEAEDLKQKLAKAAVDRRFMVGQELRTEEARAKVAVDEAALKKARAEQAGDRRAGAKAEVELAETKLKAAETVLSLRGQEHERLARLATANTLDKNLVAEQNVFFEKARTGVEAQRKAVKEAKDQLAAVEARPEATPLADQEAKEAEPEVAQQVEAPPPPAEEPNTNDFDRIVDNPFLDALNNPLSTFAIDVDTASYAIVRHFLSNNQRPPKDAVRIEEMVNYFTYDYPQPTGDEPFSVNIEVARCPWNADHRLARIGLKGKEVARDKRPLSNLVFLVDVSGSMGFPNKLPLVKESLRMLTEQLGESDRVAIAVYAQAEGMVLPPTTGDQKDAIIAALDRLEAGGSTNGGAGIRLAYDLAAQHFVKGGTNRVILCTDGDFNVGVTDRGSLIRLVEERAKAGVFLSVMGFGMGNLKDATMEQVADKGNGNYAHIDTIEEGHKVFVEQMTGTLLTIAKDVKIQVDFNPVRVRSYRLIGFENRMLRAEDFRDDAKDAGEIGAGHTVTALYELVPQAPGAVAGAGADAPLGFGRKPAERKPREPEAEDLGSKYVKRVPISDPESREVLTVRLRYKAPDGDTAREFERAVTDDGKDYARASVDFKFAAAVAAFGMILRDSPHKGTATLPGVLELAEPGLGPDASGYRHGFLDLVRKAQTLLPR